MLKCYNTFEMGKAKACFLFLPHCEFSVRYREEPEHQVKDGCSSLLQYFPEFSPAPKHSPHAKALRALIHRPRNTAFAHGRVRVHSSSESVFEFQCIHSIALKGIHEQNSYVLSTQEAEDSYLYVFHVWSWGAVVTAQNLSHHQYPGGKTQKKLKLQFQKVLFPLPQQRSMMHT